MKIIICLFISLALYILNAAGQIINAKQAAKSKVESRANSKTDATIDKGLDKVEEGIKGLFKKKKKKENENIAAEEKATTEVGNNNNQQVVANTKVRSFDTYSKFDFIPGEKILYYDNFETTETGDFPTGWNTNSSAAIVGFDKLAGKWLSFLKDGYFQPEMITNMPENFTLEFEVFNRYRSSNILEYHFIIGKSNNPRADIGEELRSEAAFKFSWAGCHSDVRYEVVEKDVEMGKNSNIISKSLACNGDQFEEPAVVKFSLWRQKNRFRIYVNEEKILDIPQAFNSSIQYNVFKWKTSYMNYSNGREQDDQFMVSNIRYAVGAPDTRSKLISTGKFSTTGILFDVNADKINPSSYGTIKEIATLLKENPAIHVKIIGHTDSDGDDKANLLLSQKRAVAVKENLASAFGIEASRMQTDGKGEAEPAEANNTSQGKANNRRVEFIKL